MNERVKDLTGKAFGRLIVVGFAGIDARRNSTWNCVCTCGNTVVAYAYHLNSGATQSCGCLRKDLLTKHGHSATSMYNSYIGAKDRTTNPDNKSWDDYGGRGIKMCDEWLDSVDLFYTDMEESWKAGLTLDRIDVNGNYCKENCRWAESGMQAHNQRKRKGCSSQHKGVSLEKATGKWRAFIKICDKKLETLGSFINEVDAAIAYDNRSEQLYGDRPNKTVNINKE